MTNSSPIQHLLKSPWAHNDHSIWLATQFQLRRNLKAHLFPHKLESKKQLELTKMLELPLSKCTLFKKGFFCLMKDLSADEKLFLYEYYLQAHSYHSMHHAEGLYVSPKHHIHALTNSEDHLVLHMIDTKNELEKAWNTFLKLEHELSKELEFAFDPHFGFLTSDLKRCGTALKVEIFLHLPVLIQTSTLSKHLSQLNTQTVSWTSLSNDPSSFVGNLLILSNYQTLGISEEMLIKNLQTNALNLILAERKARETIALSKTTAIKDLVNKAFGTLKHALKLDVIEALNLISLCKLGIEMNWVQNISVSSINELMFLVRKGSMGLQATAKDADSAELRAKLISKKLEMASI